MQSPSHEAIAAYKSLSLPKIQKTATPEVPVPRYASLCFKQRRPARESRTADMQVPSPCILSRNTVFSIMHTHILRTRTCPTLSASRGPAVVAKTAPRGHRLNTTVTPVKIDVGTFAGHLSRTRCPVSQRTAGKPNAGGQSET